MSKFANGASVVDQDDCAVELDQVVSLVETGCKGLNGAGMKVVIKANQIQIDYGNAKDCPFGADCFRQSCGQEHPPGFVSKYDPCKGGKGRKGRKWKCKGGGKGKGGGKTCEAKGCSASSPYYPGQEVSIRFKPGTMTSRSDSRPMVTPFQREGKDLSCSLSWVYVSVRTHPEICPETCPTPCPTLVN